MQAQIRIKELNSQEEMTWNRLALYLCIFSMDLFLGKELKQILNKEKYDKIKESKTSTTSAKLCQGLPEEFEQYFNIVRGLEFEERPDYTVLRNLFKSVIINDGLEYDLMFDWIKIAD